MWSNIYVETGPQGLGVFALKTIAPGEEVLTFTGRHLSSAQAFPVHNRDSTTLQIGPNLFLEPQSPARYVHHSCDPNCGIRKENRLIAIREIQPHEAITYDYSTALDEPDRTVMCHCGSAHCRKVIHCFRDLPILLQIHYLQLEIVQPFIVQELCDQYLSPDETSSPAVCCGAL